MKVLILGSGVTGMTAAIELAEQGNKVTVLEKEPFAAGIISFLDEQFPTNDCGYCKLMLHCSEFSSEYCMKRDVSHPNIDILTNAEIIKLDGKEGNFKVTVKKNPRFVNDKCIACDKCIEVCPEESEGKKAIFVKQPLPIPYIYAINMDICTKCKKCVDVCPTDAIDLEEKPEDVKLEVDKIILSPGVSLFDPTPMKEFGYGKLENVYTSLEFEKRIVDGYKPKKVAFIQCVGSRDNRYAPYCSYACCMHSIKEAYMVEKMFDAKSTIFYMDMRVFGKGYQEYYDKSTGKNIQCVLSRPSNIFEKGDNLAVKYTTIDGKIHEEDFDSVVLAVAQLPPKNINELTDKLGVELNEYGFAKVDSNTLETSKKGIFACGAFTGPKDIPDSVIEAQAVARSEGKPKEEIKETEEEEPKIGILLCKCGNEISEIVDLNKIAENVKSLEDVESVQIIDYLCNELDKTKDLDKVNRLVIGACVPYGFESKWQSLGKKIEIVNLREWCAWIHDDKEKATEKANKMIAVAVEKLRYGKDVQETVSLNDNILIIGGTLEGLTAALSLAENNVSVTLIEKSEELKPFVIHEKPIIDDLMEKIVKNKNIKIIKGVEVNSIEGQEGNFEVSYGDIKETYGSIIVATGAEHYVPTEHLYGKNSNVVALKDLTPDKLKNAKIVVMIQCVGSRNDEHPYCSRGCCNYAIMNAIKIRENNPDTSVIIIYRDIMTYGLYEKLYDEAREKGVLFIESADPKVFDKDGLTVEVYDPVLGKNLKIKSDLVVLSTGIVGNNQKLAKILDVEEEDGFLKEVNPKYRPLELKAGIFVCGLAHSPRNLEERMISAVGAATKAYTTIKKTKSRKNFAVVNLRKCVGCGQCIKNCPVEAISLDEDLKIAQVNSHICQACGTCVMVCPSGSINLTDWKNDQIDAIISTISS